MIAGAHVRVDPETGADHALAGRYRLRHGGTNASLAGKLALAVGYDDAQAFAWLSHGLLQCFQDPGNAVGAHALYPGQAKTPERGLDVDAAAAALLVGDARRNVL